jgi:hypothetical protein
MEKADAITTVKSGYINGYSDLASASRDNLVAMQHIDSASGNQINSQTKSTFYSASLFNGLKSLNAEVRTMTFGDLTGYDGISNVSKDLVEARQSGHIEGAFNSKAVSGRASKIRSSNYGNEYDLNMQAKKNAYGSSVSGTLGYYVDSNNLIANRIQGAVDASESGDAVNVASGTYFENVQIDKSLTVKGSGASDTIVDGNQSGSVFTIGKNDPSINVSLSGMTIQGGTGSPVETSPGYTSLCGGGILNYATIELKDSNISANSADYGGGIYNEYYSATLDLESGSVVNNTANLNGGGVYNNLGTLIGNLSIVHDNTPDQIVHSVD